MRKALLVLGILAALAGAADSAPGARPLAEPAIPYQVHLPVVMRNGPVTSDLQITGILVDGIEPTHESDEYVTLRNTGAFAVTIAGWELHAEPSGAVFGLPAMVWLRGLECRVYTDELLDTDCGFSFASPVELWPADGGCAALYNQDGALVSAYCYP